MNLITSFPCHWWNFLAFRVFTVIYGREWNEEWKKWELFLFILFFLIDRLCKIKYSNILTVPLTLFQNGDVCISILHPPVDDPQSGELPSERWNPTQNVRYSILSVFFFLQNSTKTRLIFYEFLIKSLSECCDCLHNASSSQFTSINN